jgi:hypothetical protein
MSKSGSGEILDIDPAALEDYIPFIPEEGFVPSDTFVNPPGDAGVSMAAPAEIPAVPAMSAIEQFYGSPTQITQPDAGYYEEFPLPGAQTQQAVNNPTIPIFEPVVIPDTSTSAPFAPQDLQPYTEFLQTAFRPDTSQFLTMADLPTYNQFDQRYLEDQINELAMSRPMDTSQFLTMADLPTYDTSQFITASDLPTYQQFDPTELQNQIDELAMAQPMDTSQFLTAADLPTYQQFDPSQLQSQITALQNQPAVDTSQFLTAADLPTYDTSQFLTAADLPTYQQFDPTALQQEIADLQAQIGLLGQAPTQTLSQAQPYAPILDFAVR